LASICVHRLSYAINSPAYTKNYRRRSQVKLLRRRFRRFSSPSARLAERCRRRGVSPESSHLASSARRLIVAVASPRHADVQRTTPGFCGREALTSRGRRRKTNPSAAVASRRLNICRNEIAENIICNDLISFPLLICLNNASDISSYFCRIYPIILFCNSIL
jgi:hypothetical protein